MSFELFIGWLVLSFVIGFLGSSRKIGFGGAFFASLLLSPIIGLIITLVSKSNDDEEYKERTLRVQQEQQETLIKMSLPKPSAVSGLSIIQELEKLKNLKDGGVINEDEFLNLKKKILDSNNSGTSTADTKTVLNYTRTEKLTTDEQLQFLNETDLFKNPEVRINDAIPNNGFYRIYFTDDAFKIIDGKVSDNYSVRSFKQKDESIIEIGYSYNNLDAVIYGCPVWLNDELAPDGKYDISLLDKIMVINGIADSVVNNS
tara:strand:+ start:547 stop:1323 length:777 start_codon:yes stop_codon:yes gene_type:complete